jgi:hypothetical protein
MSTDPVLHRIDSLGGFLKWFGTEVTEARGKKFNHVRWIQCTRCRRSVGRRYSTLGDNWLRRHVGSQNPEDLKKSRPLDPVDTSWMIRPSISSEVQKNNKLEKLGLLEVGVLNSYGSSIGEYTHR